MHDIFCKLEAAAKTLAGQRLVFMDKYLQRLRRPMVSSERGRVVSKRKESGAI